MSAGEPPPSAPLDDRGQSADDRNKTADDRDATADDYDQMSTDRDARSDARDRRADAREQDQPRLDPNVVSDRIGARRDRQNSANDRIHAAHDRRAASEDRDLAARERSSLVVCELTGAALRGPGLAELEREIVKAERTGQPFVLAFIDVDGLKAINDAHGHSAGDEVLKGVVDTIRGTVRDYDLVVRYGGDEFLCGLLDLSLADAMSRFDAVRAAGDRSGAFTVGLAQLGPGEELADLIERADRAMYKVRGRAVQRRALDPQ